jgi:hypothetical protein
MGKITCVGETNFRYHHQRFGIKRADPAPTCTSLERPVRGKALLDPHGDVVEELVLVVPE